MRGRSLALAVAVLAQASAASAAGVTVKAQAGLDGMSRPGRWTPVRVEIDTETEDVDGSLLVRWGDARVTRQVDVAAPSRRVLELYVRTGDPRPTIEVRLEAGGRDLAHVTVPVRLAGIDDPMVVCAHHAPAADDGECSVAIADVNLPRSWRGYDAATEVRVGDAAILDAAQERAVETWRAMRRLENAGAPAPAVGAAAPAEDAVSGARAALAGYVGVLVIATIAWPWRRRSLAMRAALICTAILLAAAAAGTIGRFSPAIVHHASVAQQFEHAPGTLVSMRATAEFPTRRRFSVSTTVDGAIDQRDTSPNGDEERFDAAGRPLLDADAHLGAARSFTLEGIADFRALEVSRAGQLTRVSNVSGQPLTNCEWPDGLSASGSRVLPAGGYVETKSPIDGPDPVVTCRYPGAPVDFVERHTAVRTQGATTVMYHLRGTGPGDDPH